jgi:hypothetical protein
MTPLTEQEAALTSLLHDIGKHIIRCAKNLRDNPLLPLSDSVFRLLIADLYGKETEPKPSEKFRETVRKYRLYETYPDLAHVADLFFQIEGLEMLVRDRETSAIQLAMELAIRVEAGIRAIVEKILAAKRPPRPRPRKSKTHRQ